MEEEQYKNVSHRKSDVWKYFLLSQSNLTAKCTICSSVLKTSGTSSLISHLVSKHQLAVKRCGDHVQQCETAPQPSSTRGEMIARIVSVQRLTFRQIANFPYLRNSLIRDGYDIPSSAAAIKEIFMKEYGITMRTTVLKIQEEKACGQRYSLSFDEATARSNRRYVSFNLHKEDGSFHSLGLVRVEGSMSAERLVSLVKERLEVFSLDLDCDIASTVTDGASIMKKVGRMTSPVHISCMAHGLHLCVCDILYSKPGVPQIDDFSDEDEDNNDGADSGHFVPQFKNTIEKVRQVVRVFRKSPLKNDILQKFVKQRWNREQKLILDTKTRWNSLLLMLERFHKLQKEVRLALVELDGDFPFDERQLQGIEQLVQALQPLKWAVEKLCREDCDILFCDRVLLFTLDRLKEMKTAISNALLETFGKRVKERRDPTLYHLANYLDQSSYMEGTIDEFGEVVSREGIHQLAVELLERLHPKPVDLEAHSELEEVVQADPLMTSISSLDEAFDGWVSSRKQSYEPPTVSVDCQLAEDMVKYEVTHAKSPNLQKVHQAVKTMKPTSIEPERAFSSLGLFGSRLRARLNDDCLDALVMMRQHYRST